MLKIFSGTSNEKLTDEVLQILDVPLSKSEVIRFDNSEVRVRIEEDVKNETCVVIQPTSNPSDTSLMELFFFCDALKRREAKKVCAFIPYFGYARQDVQHREGECVSANVIIRFLESIGFDKAYTIDLHDEATEGIFSIPFKNITSLPLLAKEIRAYLKNKVSPDNIAVVSPDQGGVERARKFGEYLFETDGFSLAVIEKKRNLNEKHQTKALDLYGNVEGKIVILVDDIVTSGGTLVNATDLCLERGAQAVYAAIAHHDFSAKAPQRLQNSKIEKFFTTNTIALKEEHVFEKLVEISVAPLIAEELRVFFKKHLQ